MNVCQVQFGVLGIKSEQTEVLGLTVRCEEWTVEKPYKNEQIDNVISDSGKCYEEKLSNGYRSNGRCLLDEMLRDGISRFLLLSKFFFAKSNLVLPLLCPLLADIT